MTSGDVKDLLCRFVVDSTERDAVPRRLQLDALRTLASITMNEGDQDVDKTVAAILSAAPHRAPEE